MAKTNINRQLPPDSIRDRTATRIAVAVTATLVACIGVWGAATSVRSVQDYSDAKRLERAVEHLRYGLAVERSAVRAADATRTSRELTTGARLVAESMRAVRANAAPGDEIRVAAIRRSHQALLDDARALVREAETSAVPPTLADRASFEADAAALDAGLMEFLLDVRGRSAETWPQGGEQTTALASTGLLLLLGLATCTVLLMRLAGYRRRLERARRNELARLERAALSDSLTGLGNHRAFHDDLAREIGRRVRTGSCFSIVMLDLDGLKGVNDTLGHRAGDERIRAVAECLLADGANRRAYRTGGDEFMVLLPDERAWGALTYARALQATVARHRKAVRVSCGIAESSGLDSADTLVHQADVALYEAKRTGRQIVVYAGSLGPKTAERGDDVASRRQRRLLANALVRAVDAKDAGTRTHSETVSTLSALIAERLGLDGDRVEQIAVAGLLHDVGKIGVADELLRKDSGLDPEERDAMLDHVYIGHAIVTAAGLDRAAHWILHHHENVDGSGYPNDLAGAEIPLESRIIRVADAFEAMTGDRYDGGRSPAVAFAELEAGIGTQFDGSCVKALRKAVGPNAVEPASTGAAGSRELSKPVMSIRLQAASR